MKVRVDRPPQRLPTLPVRGFTFLGGPHTATLPSELDFAGSGNSGGARRPPLAAPLLVGGAALARATRAISTATQRLRSPQPPLLARKRRASCAARARATHAIFTAAPWLRAPQPPLLTPQVVALLLALVASCSALVTAPLRAAAPRSAVAMSAGEPASRRAVLASLLFAVPASASAIVPGLNGPGLVPAKKPSGARPAWESIRDNDTNHFWSPTGIMDSVPKVKGIITPKTAGFVTK